MAHRAEYLRFDKFAQILALQSLIRPSKDRGSPGHTSRTWRRIDSLQIEPPATRPALVSLVVVAVPVSSRKTKNGISGSAIGGKGLLIISREMQIDQAERSMTLYRLTIRKATFMSMTSKGGDL